MVGNHYTGSTGFNSLQCTCHGHNSLDYEGATCIVDYLAHFFNTLAAGIGVDSLQEGQSRTVHIHCGGENVLLFQNIQFCKDGFLVPGLDGGAAYTADLEHIIGSAAYDIGVRAISGQGHDTVFCSGLYEYGVIGAFGVFVAIVHQLCANGSDKNGSGKFVAEKLKAYVGIGIIGAESVHVDADLLPFVVVACCHITGELAAGAGHGVAAGAAVAYGAGFAVRAAALSCCGENFVVIHGIPPDN